MRRLMLLVMLFAGCVVYGEEKAVRKHWLVSGEVQGVGFRAFTHRNARELKLKGWVRNLLDGRVEIVAEGPAAEVEKLLEKVKKGPEGSRVDGVKEAKVDEKEELKEFEIRDTGRYKEGE